MARVTVEDCLRNVKNRFELVIVAAQRARQLMRGKEAKVDWDNDKPTVVALREIAAGFTTAQNINSTESSSHEEHTPEIFHVVAVEKIVEKTIIIPAVEPIVVKPIVEEPVVEKPVAEEPVAEEPIAEEPIQVAPPEKPTEEE